MPTFRSIVSIAAAAVVVVLAARRVQESPVRAAAATPATGRAAAARPDLGAPGVVKAYESIRPEVIGAHIHFLADDLLEGRAPGTPGYDIAAAYVASQFRALGLAPAGTDGYFQPVPFVAAVIDPAGCELTVTRDGRSRTLAWADDYLVRGDVVRESALVEGEAVFVGFGVTAPELDYDDYANVDVKGKIAVYLGGAPARFPNDQRAYHSQGSRKRELAVKHGAIGILTMRTPQDQARSPWAASQRRVRSPNLSRLDPQGRPRDTQPALRASISLSARGTEVLFAGGPHPLAEVYEAAEASNPPRFALGATVRMTTRSAHRRVTSPNIVARLAGSDRRLAPECVIYSAHLDHLGITAPVRGDSINNGAYDNASGIAALIEVARAFRAMPAPPRRSILFLATTAEEQGLEGAYHFADSPTVPLDRIVANVNMDMFLMLHPVHDMIAHGASHSTLGPIAEAAGRQLGFTLSPDPAPEEVVFIRSDQFPFIKKGVPAIFLDAGTRTGSPKVDGAAQERTWRRTAYHSPQDDRKQAMDLEAGATWARANFLIGLQVANDDARPVWNPGDFFGETFGRSRAARATGR